jgi:hypothetical protein
MKLKKIEKQRLLEAKLRALQIKKKEKAMQARTGSVWLSSSYENIHTKLKNSSSIYGYVTDVNKGMTFQDLDHLEAV